MTDVSCDARIVFGQSESAGNVRFKVQLLKFSVLRRITVDVFAIAIVRIEINAPIAMIPLQRADSRVEVFSNRLYLAGSQIHDKCLCVEIIGNRMITAILSDSAEGLGTCCKQ